MALNGLMIGEQNEVISESRIIQVREQLREQAEDVLRIARNMKESVNEEMPARQKEATQHIAAQMAGEALGMMTAIALINEELLGIRKEG